MISDKNVVVSGPNGVQLKRLAHIILILIIALNTKGLSLCVFLDQLGRLKKVLYDITSPLRYNFLPASLFFMPSRAFSFSSAFAMAKVKFSMDKNDAGLSIKLRKWIPFHQ